MLLIKCMVFLFIMFFKPDRLFVFPAIETLTVSPIHLCQLNKKFTKVIEMNRNLSSHQISSIEDIKSNNLHDFEERSNAKIIRPTHHVQIRCCMKNNKTVECRHKGFIYLIKMGENLVSQDLLNDAIKSVYSFINYSENDRSQSYPLHSSRKSSFKNSLDDHGNLLLHNKQNPKNNFFKYNTIKYPKCSKQHKQASTVECLIRKSFPNNEEFIGNKNGLYKSTQISVQPNLLLACKLTNENQTTDFEIPVVSRKTNFFNNDKSLLVHKKITDNYNECQPKDDTPNYFDIYKLKANHINKRHILNTISEEIKKYFCNLHRNKKNVRDNEIDYTDSLNNVTDESYEKKKENISTHKVNSDRWSNETNISLLNQSTVQCNVNTRLTDKIKSKILSVRNWVPDIKPNLLYVTQPSFLFYGTLDAIDDDLKRSYNITSHYKKHSKHHKNKQKSKAKSRGEGGFKLLDLIAINKHSHEGTLNHTNSSNSREKKIWSLTHSTLAIIPTILENVTHDSKHVLNSSKHKNHKSKTESSTVHSKSNHHKTSVANLPDSETGIEIITLEKFNSLIDKTIPINQKVTTDIVDTLLINSDSNETLLSFSNNKMNFEYNKLTTCSVFLPATKELSKNNELNAFEKLLSRWANHTTSANNKKSSTEYENSTETVNITSFVNTISSQEYNFSDTTPASTTTIAYSKAENHKKAMCTNKYTSRGKKKTQSSSNNKTTISLRSFKSKFSSNTKFKEFIGSVTEPNIANTSNVNNDYEEEDEDAETIKRKQNIGSKHRQKIKIQDSQFKQYFKYGPILKTKRHKRKDMHNRKCRKRKFRQKKVDSKMQCELNQEPEFHGIKR